MGTKRSTKKAPSTKLSELPGAASALSSEQQQGQEQGQEKTQLPSAEDSSATQDQVDGGKYIRVADALTDFDPTPLGEYSSLRLRRIFGNASISSPLGLQSMQWDSETDGYLYTEIDQLFLEVVAEEASLQEEIMDNEDFFKKDRRTGFLCWWEYAEPKLDKDLYYDSDDQESVIETFSRDLNYGWIEDEFTVTL